MVTNLEGLLPFVVAGTGITVLWDLVPVIRNPWPTGRGHHQSKTKLCHEARQCNQHCSHCIIAIG
jgi:hypothetical protein